EHLVAVIGRVREHVLRCGDAVDDAVVEELLLRRVRPGRLHHRRQAAGLPLGRCAVGACVRLLVVVAPAAERGRGRGERGPAVAHRSRALRRVRGHGRRGGARADAGVGFNTKMLAAWIPGPAFALTVIAGTRVISRASLRSLALRLGVLGLATLVVSGSWLVVVDAW